MVLKLYSIITCSLLSLQVSAWTQSQGFFGHRIVTTLRLRSEEDEQVDMERSRLERLFTDFKDDFDEHFLPAENKLNQMVNLPVHGWVESATTDDMYDWSDVCYGEECDQCEIPAEYKQAKESVSVDVLEFLGISRAEPLQVKRRRL